MAFYLSTKLNTPMEPMNNPRIVFLGTPRIARIVLATLLDGGMSPVAVVCNPDRPVGRKQELTAPEVKQFIRERNLAIPLLQPQKLSDAYDDLRALNPDFFVVAAYNKILRPEALAIPRLGSVCVHPSLLPLYRGPAPMKSSLLDGVTETGVTLFMMDDEVDHGPIIAQERIIVSPDETYLTLEDKLGILGGELLLTTMPQLLAGGIVAVPQDHAHATLSRKYTSEDAFVPFSLLEQAVHGDPNAAQRIFRMIAGLNPEPGVWTEMDGVRWKLLASSYADGVLTLTTVQRAGGLPQPFTDSLLAKRLGSR